MCRFDDESTIEAIDRLRGEYPYAAALLCYTVVERVLKARLIQESQSPETSAITLPKKSKLGKYSGKRLDEFDRLNRDDFFKSVVRRLSLGDLEAMLPGHEREIAVDRNDLVHSNLYLRSQVGTDTTTADRERYKNALEHLRYAIEIHTSFRLNIADDCCSLVRQTGDAAAT